MCEAMEQLVWLSACVCKVLIRYTAIGHAHDEILAGEPGQRLFRGEAEQALKPFAK